MHFSLNGTEVLSLDGSGTLTPAGNIPKAAITNALTTAGASIGGNVPIAAVTNAFTTATGALLTNTCVAADGKTNTYVFVPVGGVYIVKSVTTSP